MLVKGKVFSGVLRGRPLVEIYYDRLVGLLGFEPYKGTLDIKLENRVNIELYATKALEHLLLDGTKIVYAHLAPVRLVVKNGDKYKCWAMQQPERIYDKDVIEILAEEQLKEKFSLKDGDEVWVEFAEIPERKERKGFFEKLREKLPKGQHQLMRSR